MFRRSFLLALLAAASPARAQDDSDSARARAALRRGEIRPLADLLDMVEARYDGRVIETELEQRHERWIYEFKLLPQSGRMCKVIVDAATGEVIATRGPARERR
ncbi:PepSY domain-containing protein [Rhodovastum atsumiense]|uniref:PepSY domain-containing protein n=1 Tax=Rhodovastum atsumiense TaxID=504468 RepID=A0A5M6IYI2_9PROT|nr:PepSY domain-containing protein [Rhodovastum atsumiense]KAA5612428.1 PepSY domain-containing protein [Rhodovastum atsumiense]CAH2600335.1 PepSY domain-containing protein [Rhodovastum atsumiense]